MKISKVIFLEPFYYDVIDKKLDYLESDLKQEKFLANVTTYAKAQGFELVTFDPGILAAEEIAKMNDYSIMNDWLSEKLDSDKAKTTIFNTNEVKDLIKKYGTKYILKSGIVTEKSGFRNKTYFLAYLFDIQSNSIVHWKVLME